MSGPEEGCARHDERKRDQRQVNPRVSRPERQIRRQQRIENVGPEELAHGEGTICRTGKIAACWLVSCGCGKGR